MAGYGDYKMVAETVLRRLMNSSRRVDYIPVMDKEDYMVDASDVSYTLDENTIRLLKNAGAETDMGLIEPDRIAWEVAQSDVSTAFMTKQRLVCGRINNAIENALRKKGNHLDN
ncbi:MAG: hypothetical protein Q7S74_02785 [Nanoarchaeota archaeon]|nr:hypothetical protein [Nanoarchaeota archaeon]